MRIIIVGCGRVGRSLAEQLQQEDDCELTVIDMNASKLEGIADEIDAMPIVGNGASLSTLTEAEVEKCDLLIAVTNSDEFNLLCCLIAQNAGTKATVARVRNPVYSNEHEFFKQRLKINMIINPEYATASEIDNLHRLPTVTKVDTFARKTVELVKFKVQPSFGLDGMRVSEIIMKLKVDFLICGIENKEGTIIPTGSDVIHNNDNVYILASRNETLKFFKKIGMRTTQAKNSIIVGGGTVCIYLAKMLLQRNIAVKIFEKDKDRCEYLSDLLPEAVIINGDGTNRQLLMEEGLSNADSLVCLTGSDEENIFLALYGRQVCPGKVISKVNRFNSDDILSSLDLGSVVYPKYLTADYILQFVRAYRNATGSNLETLYHIMDGKAEALEFLVRDHSPVVGVPLTDLTLKPNTLVGCINRDRKVFIPRGHDMLQVGDAVIIVTMAKGLRDIRDILA